jgi:unsaturated chondroitin disaccharide hydrolase
MTEEVWIASALGTVMARTALTRDAVGSRFPLFAAPDTGRWTTSRRGSWTGGFWAGLLWLRARHTGEERDREAASEATERLADGLTAGNATCALTHWYGTALASGERAHELKDRAGLAALAAMDRELGLVPSVSASDGPRTARVDGVPGTVSLLASTGPEGTEAALSHLERHLELCLSQEPSRFAWHYEETSGWQPCGLPAPGWSRGGAWLLLAVADGLTHLSGPSLAMYRLNIVAHRLAEQWTRPPGGSLVPRAEPGNSRSPLDTSAPAIAAVALLKLAAAQQRPELRVHAVRILNTLVRSHTTGVGAPDTANRPAGMLLDGCYDAGRGTAVRHELIWGDFFLALAMAVLTGLVDVNEV